MSRSYLYRSFIVLFFLSLQLSAQSVQNCFLEDYSLKKAVIPPFKDAASITGEANVTVTINVSDTLGNISKYIFGNAFPSWLGNVATDPVLLQHLQDLGTPLIRYPGGSWSDIFFWDGKSPDIPDSLIDGTNGKPYKFTPQYGRNSSATTLENYYSMLDNLNTQGFITINYAYARYGLSQNPAQQAAHYAADWVRYDDGRTKFWEIGNESAGPWEAGQTIDTTKNKDGQPRVITGALYAKHFRLFVDSMKAAAKEIGSTIYIGGQVIHYDAAGSWIPAERKWNEDFFKGAGDVADFYVMHNYYGGKAIQSFTLLDQAASTSRQNIDFINQDIKNKNAPKRPITVTEWNMDAPDNEKTSVINGMQSVILFNEFIKRNCGMTCRWPLANWEADGMFYRGNSSGIPTWNPRPDYFYEYYLHKFTGDHVINASADNVDVLAYSTTFSSGHVGVVLVNKWTADLVVKLFPKNKGVGNKYYVYSLTGDGNEFSQKVLVNGVSPTGTAWGPLENLKTLQALAYPVNKEIKINLPSRSVQFILIEPGNNYVSVKDDKALPDKFILYQNYPNPFNPQTLIKYSLPYPLSVTLKVYNMLGSEVSTLVNKEYQTGGIHEIPFNASGLSSGVYLYKIQAGDFLDIKKLALIK